MCRRLCLVMLLSAAVACTGLADEDESRAPVASWRQRPAAPRLEVPAARARNVILFLADAGGLATINAAGIYNGGGSEALFLYRLPHIALSETSSASKWVTDSAAAMTAIVTGHKTNNGVVALSSTAVMGGRDGEPLQTILEHAEQRGLSTGIVTNSSVLSATPAACDAHVNDRRNRTEVLRQLLRPRFGDGVDVLIGAGLSDAREAAEAAGLAIPDAFRAAKLPLFASLDKVPANARRAAVLFTHEEFDLAAATLRAVDLLSKNGNGYFLMVESNVHVEEIVGGLERVLAIDRAMRRAAERAGPDTLILFTADHSYDFRLNDGWKGERLLADVTDPEYGDGDEEVRLDNIRRDDDHTGEDVLVAAMGPGAERVHGFLANTDLFHIMMSAYGWE